MRLGGASTRTSASPPLTWLGWLESTVRSTVFASAAGAIAIVIPAMSPTRSFLRIPTLLVGSGSKDLISWTIAGQTRAHG